jgi:tRNA(fMet)-specific endonuclease VapC
VLYFLDTNALSEMLKGNARIVSRLRAISPPDDVEVPVIAWFEIVQGRAAALLTASDEEQLLRAQSRLDTDLESMSKLPIRGIDNSASRQFQSLLSHKTAKKLRRPDLLIACIVLAYNAILVTRNVKDFVNVHGLQIQNWFN